MLSLQVDLAMDHIVSRLALWGLLHPTQFGHNDEIPDQLLEIRADAV